MLYTEERLLTGSPSVLSLFAGNPFTSAPPQEVRAIVYQYWFTDWPEKRQGLWWRRRELGLYAPEIERSPDGKFTITALPENGQILPPVAWTPSGFDPTPVPAMRLVLSCILLLMQYILPK